MDGINESREQDPLPSAALSHDAIAGTETTTTTKKDSEIYHYLSFFHHQTTSLRCSFAKSTNESKHHRLPLLALESVESREKIRNQK